MFQLFDSGAHFREVVSAPAARDLTAARLDLDQRFPQLIGLRKSASETFSRRKIVVVGVGSVGRRVALHLARLGIAVLWLIDPDRYDDRANLITQEILATDLGHNKANRTGEACKAISPATRVLVYEGKLQDLDPVTMADADAVFLATDNLAVEVDASHMFRLTGTPIVQASVHGETLVTQVRFLENRRADGPCLICGFGPDEHRHLSASSIFSCTGTGSAVEPAEQINVLPTTSTSFLCSLAADFALIQWTRYTLDLGETVADTLLQYCGYTHRTTQTKLNPKKTCASGHQVLERAKLPKRLAGCTPSELVRFAGFHDQPLDEISLTLGNLTYVASAVCNCAQHAVDRFVPKGESLGQCPTCDERITPQPYYTFRPTPGNDLDSRRDRPFRQLGGESADWAVVGNGDRSVLLCANSELNSTKSSAREKIHET